jgi:O-antigen/teichoic acid export membrane protein
MTCWNRLLPPRDGRGRPVPPHSWSASIVALPVLGGHVEDPAALEAAARAEPAGHPVAGPAGRQLLRTALDRRLRAHLAEPLFRNAYALMLATVLTSGLGVLFWLLAARLYTPEQVGRGSAVISTMHLLANIAQLGLATGLARFLPLAGRATTGLIRKAYALTALSGALLAVGFVLTAPRLSEGLRFFADVPLLGALFVLGVSTWCVFALQDAALTGVRRAVWVPVENAVFGLAKVLLVVALAASLPGYGILVSWIVPMALILVPVNVLLFARAVPRHIRETHAQARPPHLRDMARFVSVDYLGSLMSHAGNSALPLLVVAFAGAEANAHFYMAWTIGVTLDLIAANIALSLTVEGSRDEDNVAVRARRALRRCLQIVLPGVAVLVLLAPWALSVFGTSYVEASLVLQLFALASVPRAATLVYVSVLRVQRRVGRVALVQAATWTIMLPLTVVLLSRVGITGVALAWLTAQTAVSLAVLPDLRAALRGSPTAAQS